LRLGCDRADKRGLAGAGSGPKRAKQTGRSMSPNIGMGRETTPGQRSYRPSGLEEKIRHDSGHEAGMTQAELEVVQVEIGVRRLGEEQAAVSRRVTGKIGEW
jgi:hypothetical protein